MRLVQSRLRGAQERLAYTAPRRGGAGWYYVQVKIGTAGSGPYVLSYTKR
jgi:hypothetical protein